MSRAAAREQTDSVSLFPFLAVLLCTMGALLILLVGLAKAARDRVAQHQAAAEAAAVAKKTTAPEASQQLAEVQQYMAQLSTVRLTANARLREGQQRLTDLEDHMRRLKDELGSLQLAARELEGLENAHEDDRQQAQIELERVRKLVVELEEKIAQLEAEQQGKGKSYAIVPYEGRNGTLRPTLYIECRADRVILQPEGVELSPADFQSPMGAGNPLASALRTAREYTLRISSPSLNRTEIEPYPLILVRPDGIGSYYKVREAIRGWEADFGYELVDGNWNLRFPAPNPELARLEQRAIEEARMRRQLLAEAAPKAYRGANASFDIVEEGAGDESGYGSGAVGSGSGNGSYAGGQGNGGIGSGEAAGIPSEGGAGGDSFAGLGGEGSSANASLDGPMLASGAGGDGSAELGQADGETEGLAQSQGQGNGNGSYSGLGSAEYSEAGAPQPGFAGEFKPGGVSQTAGSAGAGPASSAGGTGSPSGGSPGGSSSLSSGMQQVQGSASAAEQQAMSAQANPQSGASASFETQPASGRTHGKDWAIRDATPASVAIRRTVQMQVGPNQIAILPDRSQTGRPVENNLGKSVPLANGRAIPVDQIQTGLWEHMDRWGSAGNGLYWKPVLVLQIAPGGERRAAELTQLLRHSGVEIRTSDTAQRTDQSNHATPR